MGELVEGEGQQQGWGDDDQLGKEIVHEISGKNE
jgi:hypothetical protein